MNDSGPVIHGLNARGMYPANLSSMFNKYIAGNTVGLDLFQWLKSQEHEFQKKYMSRNDFSCPRLYSVFLDKYN